MPTPPSRIPGIRTACGELRTVSIRTSLGIGPWARPSPEPSKITFAVRARGRGLPPEGPNGVPACGRSMDREGRAHVLGFVVVLGVALLLHYGLLPVLGRRVGIRETPAYFLAFALVPVALWLIPAFSKVLARGAFETHRKLFGKGGVYVRLPGSEPIRLWDTLLMSIGPFAIDVLVMAEILFLQGTADLRQLVVGFVAFPILLLAGLLTSLLPGAWLLDALDLRLVNATRGDVIRPAEWFERTLGPVGAVAILVGFVTLLHTSGYSYESALFSWASGPCASSPRCSARSASIGSRSNHKSCRAWARGARGPGSRPGSRFPPSSANGSHRRPETPEGFVTARVGFLTQARRTGIVGATGSQNSFRVSRSVGRNVRAVGTSRRSTSARTVDSTKSSARPRFSPRGPIACVPPWKTMFSSVPTRFVYTRGIAFSITRAGRILSKNGFEVAGGALMIASR